MSKPRRPDRRRLVTAAIATGAVLAIGASAWMFASQRDEPTPAPSSASRSSTSDGDDERVENVLELPERDDDSPGGEEGSPGRTRLDPDEVTSPRSNDDDSTSAGGEPRDALPAVLRNLRGRTVAIATAAAAGTGPEARTARLGALNLPCAEAADQVRAARQEQLASTLATELERAGAVVARADQPATCVAARARRMERSSFAIVIGDADASRVLPAPSATADGAPTARSRALASELAGWLGLDGSTTAASASARREVAGLGAVTATADSPTAVVLVEVRPNDLVPSRTVSIARSIASAIATTASHASSSSVTAKAERPTAGARP